MSDRTFVDTNVLIYARSGARRIVSEDVNAGQAIAGVTIQNPFKELSSTKPTRAQSHIAVSRCQNVAWKC